MDGGEAGDSTETSRPSQAIYRKYRVELEEGRDGDFCSICGVLYPAMSQNE